MHLLATEAGRVARDTVATLSAARQGRPGVDAAVANRLHGAVTGRLQAENDRVGLEALKLFESDPEAHAVLLLIILANKANADPGYRAHLQELVLAARRQY